MRPVSRTTLQAEALDDRTVPAVIDLTTPGAIGSANGVVFTQYGPPLLDSLQVKPFLQLDGPLLGAAALQGYNTDARPTQFNANSAANLTRSLRTSESPTVMVGGVAYREFVLDVKQLGLLQPRVSLDQLRIYVGATENLSGYNSAAKTLAGQVPVYDLDADGDSWVMLNANLNAPLTSGDMRMYVPDSLVAGSEYVYLFSKFGEHVAQVGGSDRWSVHVGEPPAPPNFVPSPPPPSPPSPPPPPATTATIAGVVYGDLNSNAQPDDNETGLADRVVYLDDDGDGQLDEGETSRTTDAEGRYSFADLVGGETYTVRVVTSEGEFAQGFDVTPAESEVLTLDIGVVGESQT